MPKLFEKLNNKNNKNNHFPDKFRKIIFNARNSIKNSFSSLKHKNNTPREIFDKNSKINFNEYDK